MIPTTHPSAEPGEAHPCGEPSRPAYDAGMTVVCDGLLVEPSEGVGKCDQGTTCQALGLRGDYEAFRAAHGRVIAAEQAENTDEYGGEA
jgi:hypothetical protein